MRDGQVRTIGGALAAELLETGQCQLALVGLEELELLESTFVEMNSVSIWISIATPSAEVPCARQSVTAPEAEYSRISASSTRMFGTSDATAVTDETKSAINVPLPNCRWLT